MATITALLFVGALLIVLESVLPGLIAGIIGVCCIGAAVAIAYIRYDFQTGNTVLAVVIVGMIIGTIIYAKYFPESRVAQLFISKGTVGNLDNEQLSLLHQSGETITALRPSGMATINGQRVDVVSEGSFIEAGRPIRVVAIEGLRVVVRAVG